MDSYARVYGSLLGAAIGDAMGAVTESKTTAMIVEQFSGFVSELLPGPSDTFVSGCEAGQVTDDFSLAYFTALGLVENPKKIVTEDLAVAILLEWSNHTEFFRFAGPTTRAAVLALRSGSDAPLSELHFLACDNSKATNGSAMKIFPTGLINPGNLTQAVEDAIVIALPTHNTSASLSGASAIAAATALAVSGANIERVLQAGVEGAEIGFDIGCRVGKHVSVASVPKRIRWAIEIGQSGLSWEDTMNELGSLVGAGIAITESVPCVFGILAACGEDVMSGIRMGVNIGNDTDTIASMVGAISGAMSGSTSFPPSMITTVQHTNNMDLSKLASNLVKRFY